MFFCSVYLYNICTTSNLGCTQKQMDLVFIVDGSDSVCEQDPTFVNGVCNNWKLIIEFMVNIVNVITEEDMKTRVAVIVFNDSPEIKWYLET